MNCKEFERLIPDYVEKKMDYLTLKHFSDHMEHCPDCKEELVIQFLVTKGIERLEDGNVFDLQGELNQRLEEARRKVRLYGRISKIGLLLEILAVGICLGIVVYILL